MNCDNHCAFKLANGGCYYNIKPLSPCINYMHEKSCMLCKLQKQYFCFVHSKRISSEDLQCPDFQPITDLADFYR